MKLPRASVPKLHPIHFFSSHFPRVCTALGSAKVPRESRRTERSTTTLADHGCRERGRVNVEPSFAVLNFPTVMWAMPVFINVAHPVMTEILFLSDHDPGSIHSPQSRCSRRLWEALRGRGTDKMGFDLCIRLFTVLRVFISTCQQIPGRILKPVKSVLLAVINTSTHPRGIAQPPYFVEYIYFSHKPG